MQPNTVFRAAKADLTHQPVPAAQAIRDAPSTAASTLGEFGGLEIGVWEMSPGVMTDIEADEVFVVLSGSATVEFADGTATLARFVTDATELSVRWTLRKVYLT